MDSQQIRINTATAQEIEQLYEIEQLVAKAVSEKTTKRPLRASSERGRLCEPGFSTVVRAEQVEEQKNVGDIVETLKMSGEKNEALIL